MFGRRSVAEQLAAAPASCRRLSVARGAKVPPEILERARALGLPVDAVAREELGRRCGRGNHQGVCLEVADWTYQPLEDLVARARRPGRLPLLLALDSVQDPRNLGAVLRVADGLGAAGVVVPKDRSAGLSALAARTASGAAASVPVAQVTNLARCLDELKAEGFWVVGAAGDGEDLYRADVPTPAVLVLGSEQAGIRPNVVRRCDRLLAVPMAGQCASLNLAVACGVVGYELLRRFRAGDGARA